MTLKTNHVVTLEDTCLKISGLRCWAVIAGEGAGSHVTLDFGRKIKRQRPIRNPFIDKVSRNFSGEWHVFIQNCAWRLSDKDGMVCSSKSDNRVGGEMLTGLRRLIELRVKNVDLNRQGPDLSIEFANRLTLMLFADCADRDQDGDNYSVFGPNCILTVGSRGQVRFEVRPNP